MFCPECGYKNVEGAAFCENCGTKLTGMPGNINQRKPPIKKQEKKQQRKAYHWGR